MARRGSTVTPQQQRQHWVKESLSAGRMPFAFLNIPKAHGTAQLVMCAPHKGTKRAMDALQPWALVPKYQYAAFLSGVTQEILLKECKNLITIVTTTQMKTLMLLNYGVTRYLLSTKEALPCTLLRSVMWRSWDRLHSSSVSLPPLTVYFM